MTHRLGFLAIAAMAGLSAIAAGCVVGADDPTSTSSTGAISQNVERASGASAPAPAAAPAKVEEKKPLDPVIESPGKPGPDDPDPKGPRPHPWNPNDPPPPAPADNPTSSDHK